MASHPEGHRGRRGRLDVHLSHVVMIMVVWRGVAWCGVALWFDINSIQQLSSFDRVLAMRFSLFIYPAPNLVSSALFLLAGI
jgi:hypothetical protein